VNLLVAGAVAVNHDNLALGNETFEAAGARFVRNVNVPDVWDANHVDRIRAATPGEIDALLDRARREYAHCHHLRFDVDPSTPPEFEARLQLDGYVAGEGLVSILEGDLVGHARTFDIREVGDASGWTAYGALKALNWAESRERMGQQPQPDVGRRFVAAERGKSPPRRYWLALIDGAPQGFLSSWEGTARVGQVEDLFVHPEYRHRGLATALLHHCVADCRAHGAGPVAIVADPTDTPKQIYAAMGWRPVAVIRQYRIATNPGGQSR
jgi:GNAT superfamily N-acetyltransferase